MINGTGMTGAALGPLLMGLMKDVTGSFNAGIYMVAGFLVLGAVIIAFIPMKATQRQSVTAGAAPESA